MLNNTYEASGPIPIIMSGGWDEDGDVEVSMEVIWDQRLRLQMIWDNTKIMFKILLIYIHY